MNHIPSDPGNISTPVQARLTPYCNYDLNGNYIANLYTGVSANFFQQMQELPNGDILVADFGVGGGVRIFSSTGNY